MIDQERASQVEAMVESTGIGEAAPDPAGMC
jgi:hypothetical protein